MWTALKSVLNRKGPEAVPNILKAETVNQYVTDIGVTVFQDHDTCMPPWFPPESAFKFNFQLFRSVM